MEVKNDEGATIKLSFSDDGSLILSTIVPTEDGRWQASVFPLTPSETVELRNAFDEAAAHFAGD